MFGNSFGARPVKSQKSAVRNQKPDNLSAF